MLKTASSLFTAQLFATAFLCLACSKSEEVAPPVGSGGDAHDHDHDHSHGGAGGLDGSSAEGLAGGPPEQLETSEYDWDLPAGFPVPWEPENNPTTKEKVELGRHLFYDVRLSGNDTTSCATCHMQEKAFTDERPVGVGSTGESHTRGSMSLANVGYASTLTWAHPLLYELERQSLLPIFGEGPIELGMKDAHALEEKLADISRYQELFADAFPNAVPLITLQQITQALGAFQRTLISGRSPYDRWIQGQDEDAITEEAKQGYELFNSERLECFHCHVGFNLSDHTHWAQKPFFDAPFHNTGLYNIGGTGEYPSPNTGVHNVSEDASDMGRFKAPTLRNIAVTAPYMHDGSIETLSEVLDHYAAGGRTVASGPHAGNGSLNPFKSDLISGFDLDEEERAALLAFFQSLTDEEFLTNPDFANPW